MQIYQRILGSNLYQPIYFKFRLGPKTYSEPGPKTYSEPGPRAYSEPGTKTYSEPFQMPKLVPFAEIVNGFLQLTIFTKGSILRGL